MNVGLAREVVIDGVAFDVVWDGNVRDGWQAPVASGYVEPAGSTWTREQGYRTEERILAALQQNYYTATELSDTLNVHQRNIRAAIQRLERRKRIRIFQKFEPRIGKAIALYGRPEYPHTMPIRKGVKFCLACGQEKPVAAFSANKRSQCSECYRAYHRQWRANSRQMQRELFAEMGAA